MRVINRHLHALRVKEAMRDAGVGIRVEADDLRGSIAVVDADRLRLRGAVAGRKMGKILHRVVIRRQQHITVVGNCHAVAEIPDDDARIVDAEQLVEVGIAWLSSTTKFAEAAPAMAGNVATRAAASSPGRICERSSGHWSS